MFEPITFFIFLHNIKIIEIIITSESCMSDLDEEEPNKVKKKKKEKKEDGKNEKKPKKSEDTPKLNKSRTVDFE